MREMPARPIRAGFYMRSDGQFGQFDNLAGVGSQSPVGDAGGLTEQRLGGVGCGFPIAGGHDGLLLQHPVVVAATIRNGLVEGDEERAHGVHPGSRCHRP